MRAAQSDSPAASGPSRRTRAGGAPRLAQWSRGAGDQRSDRRGFEAAHPDIDTDFKPIAVTGHKTFERVVRNRLDEGVPPSSFAARAGAALGRYVGYLGDDGEVALRDGALAEAHVDAVREHCRYDGRLVAVPLSVRWTNCLFYGVDVVEKAGVDPGALSTPGELADALERVAENSHFYPGAWFGRFLLRIMLYKTTVRSDFRTITSKI